LELNKIFKKTKKELTRAKILFRIISSIVLIIIEITLILGFTFTWFASNQQVETNPIDSYSSFNGAPVHLTAAFNGAPLPPDYSDQPTQIDRYAIPGDVLEFSVFVDLSATSCTQIAITASSVPDWLEYMTNSAIINYAEKITDVDDNTINISIDKTTPCNAKVTDVSVQNNQLIFTIALPNDFYNYGNCICLDFKLLFNDSNLNQNDYLGQTINIGFYANGL